MWTFLFGDIDGLNKIAKIWDWKNSFEFSYTVTINHIMSVLVSVSINQPFNGRACFYTKKP